MQINSINNTNFGLRINNTLAYKNLLAVWNENFSKKEIAMRVKKLKKSASDDVFINIDTIEEGKKLKVTISSLYDEMQKTFKFNTILIHPKTHKITIYSPKYIVRKLISFVKQYKENFADTESYYLKDMVFAIKERNKLLF